MNEPVLLAQSLVRAETVNPPGDELAAAALLAPRLEAAGFSTELHELAPGRPSLIARLAGGGDRPALCLTGHLDVVAVGGAAWSREPFGGELAEGRLHGRGSSDMKGGVAAIVVAAERLAGSIGARAGAGLELVFTAGEETGCEGAARLADAGLLERAGAIVVAEPTSNQPCVAQKGVLWLEAEATGRSAHGSAPELGENAIYAMAEAIGRLRRFPIGDFHHPLLGRATLSVGTFHAGQNVNSVPDRALAGIDIRTVSGVDHERLRAELERCVGELVELTPMLSLAPVETDPDDSWVLEVLEALTPILGERPQPGALRPFTDAAVLKDAYGGPPTIICGPGEPGQAHQTDEWCSLARIEQAVEIYVELIRRWCGL